MYELKEYRRSEVEVGALRLYGWLSFSLRSENTASATTTPSMARRATPSHIKANNAFPIDLSLSLAGHC